MLKKCLIGFLCCLIGRAERWRVGNEDRNVKKNPRLNERGQNTDKPGKK